MNPLRPEIASQNRQEQSLGRFVRHARPAVAAAVSVVEDVNQRARPNPVCPIIQGYSIAVNVVLSSVIGGKSCIIAKPLKFREEDPCAKGHGKAIH